MSGPSGLEALAFAAAASSQATALWSAYSQAMGISKPAAPAAAAPVLGTLPHTPAPSKVAALIAKMGGAFAGQGLSPVCADPGYATAIGPATSLAPLRGGQGQGCASGQGCADAGGSNPAGLQSHRSCRIHPTAAHGICLAASSDATGLGRGNRLRPAQFEATRGLLDLGSGSVQGHNALRAKDVR